MADSLGERSGSRCYFKQRSSEVIYVDEGHHSHLWDRNSVPCAVRMRSGLRMRSSERADRESNPGYLRDRQGY